MARTSSRSSLEDQSRNPVGCESSDPPWSLRIRQIDYHNMGSEELGSITVVPQQESDLRHAV
jgi:hypothetical protein